MDTNLSMAIELYMLWQRKERFKKCGDFEEEYISNLEQEYESMEIVFDMDINVAQKTIAQAIIDRNKAASYITQMSDFEALRILSPKSQQKGRV